MKKALLCLLLLSTGLSQSVTDATTTFSQVRTATGVTMTDFLADQVSGDGRDDFVVNGMYLKYGLANGVYTQYVRGVFDTQKAAFDKQFKVGVDANGDGVIDLFYGVSGSGTKGIVFQNPTGTTNNTVGSTTLGAFYNVTAFTASNYDVSNASTTTKDYEVTFAVPFTTIQTALNSLGLYVTQDTPLRYIFFTSTTTNTINQDIYGVNGINQTATFVESGAFTEYTSFSGTMAVVPEPETYAQIASLLTVGLFLRYRKRKNNGDCSSVG